MEVLGTAQLVGLALPALREDVAHSLSVSVYEAAGEPTSCCANPKAIVGQAHRVVYHDARRGQGAYNT